VTKKKTLFVKQNTLTSVKNKFTNSRSTSTILILIKVFEMKLPAAGFKISSYKWLIPLGVIARSRSTLFKIDSATKQSHILNLYSPVKRSDHSNCRRLLHGVYTESSDVFAMTVETLDQVRGNYQFKPICYYCKK
jgi:hypothetical protein